MSKVNTAVIVLFLLGVLPVTASAQSSLVGPQEGDRELSLSGTGSSDRNFDSGSFGVTGDLGWYLRDDTVAGVRQSINYASIEGENLKNDFWNGSTRGYINYQFLDDQTRPFVGGSLGGIYGDGVKDSAFAGLETGVKHYVLTNTYFLARVEYQFFFSSTSDAADAFQDDGAWAYTVGLGYNF
ncbi:hypothetical protein HOP52_02455 [Halomonas campisalis]|uniref:Outer membrane protein beta-barrel domain-containing protein n=1 Tax=Billgrantia campisalis TaxID=74661 RepID=A0ABS9P4W1_9GAMM|nr:hypothetical protein [Halomonas campisalis]MCG6656636.1 hypothetical protein [Halomonas campisalis]MDR5861824.1 hypothetical protein [Halomonas campisalis]